MKALQERIWDAERHRLEADLGARLEALFGNCPQLCGFLVGEREVEGAQAEEDGATQLELFVADLTVYPVLGARQLEMHIAHISAALADLLEDCPQAVELLPGRTFARVLH